MDIRALFSERCFFVKYIIEQKKRKEEKMSDLEMALERQRMLAELNAMSVDALKARSVYERPTGFRRTHFTKLGIPDDFVVIDTETTGLGKDDEVVEISVLDSNAAEVYHSFFSPNTEIQMDAAITSGIVMKMLVDAPRFIDEWRNICTAIADRPIAGHNLSFDRRLIQQTLEKQSGRSCQAICDRMFANMIDSMLIAKELGVKNGSRGLGKICEAMGVEQHPNHRTSHDCLGVLNVLAGFENGLYPFVNGKKQKRFNV